MKIQDKALLAGLNISQWTARKYDRNASKATANIYNAVSSEVRTTKACVAKSHLDKITKIVGKARTYHYDKTMPFSKGQAILPTGLLKDYMTDMSKYVNEFNTAVEDFIKVYPELKAEAKVNLGTLYNELDYPSEGQLRRKFDMGIDFDPIPEGSNLRITVDAEELQELQQDIETKVKDRVNVAMEDLWKRVYDVTAALKERLTDVNGKSKTFRDTLIGNIADLASILPKMNLSDDPELDAIAEELKRELANYDADDLRKDNVLRKEAVGKADSILNKLSTRIPAMFEDCTFTQSVEDSKIVDYAISVNDVIEKTLDDVVIESIKEPVKVATVEVMKIDAKEAQTTLIEPEPDHMAKLREMGII